MFHAPFNIYLLWYIISRPGIFSCCPVNKSPELDPNNKPTSMLVLQNMETCLNPWLCASKHNMVSKGSHKTDSSSCALNGIIIGATRGGGLHWTAASPSHFVLMCKACQEVAFSVLAPFISSSADNKQQTWISAGWLHCNNIG